jgi:hypothetical protein
MKQYLLGQRRTCIYDVCKSRGREDALTDWHCIDDYSTPKRWHHLSGVYTIDISFTTTFRPRLCKQTNDKIFSFEQQRLCKSHPCGLESEMKLLTEREIVLDVPQGYFVIFPMWQTKSIRVLLILASGIGDSVKDQRHASWQSFFFFSSFFSSCSSSLDSMSGITSEALHAKLAAEFSPEYLTVEDTSDGCGAKFKVIVVTDKFDSVGLLDRQVSLIPSTGLNK